jgi:polyhydroxybutyrate depolymerase
VVKERNYDCQDENEIWLYKVVGGDHDWPGAWGNFDISSSLEAWLFFEQTIGSLSIDNNLINEFKVFPNPSNNLISISNITGNFKFEIYTLKGELIKEGNYNNIPISELENGIYIIKIISDNRIISKRIIKKP